MENIETRNGKPTTDEVATVAKDITYPAYSGILRVQDDTLLTRGQSKGLKIYDEIERDCTVYGDLQKRKLAVISRPWQVDPASDDPLDIRAADLVRAQLASQSLNFDSVCLNMLDAILKGFSVGEVIWEVVKSEIVAVAIKARDQRRFGFDDQYQLRLKTHENMTPGIELPERKFIVHSFGSKDGSPFGLGLGTRLFWPAYFKRQGITAWLALADKFASPTPVGKYPNGTSVNDQNNLLNALDSLSQSAGIVIPQDMIVELLEAKASSGATTMYPALADYMDQQITFAILGESPTTKGGGGQAASAALTRNEVRLELVQADSDLLSATLNQTVVKWITEYNVPGATPPRVWRKVEEQKDLGAVATRDKTIFEMGFEPSEAYINETYGGEWTKRKILPTPTFAKKGAQDAGGLAAFAETSYASSLVSQMDDDSTVAWDAVMAHITDLVTNADSLPALQDTLTDAYGELPLDDLRKIMAQAFQLAALTGMADVAGGK
jgi:phage gp29-like protein